VDKSRGAYKGGEFRIQQGKKRIARLKPDALKNLQRREGSGILYWRSLEGNRAEPNNRLKQNQEKNVP